MSRVIACPVCDGRGWWVPPSIYKDEAGPRHVETCRGCRGKGIIIYVGHAIKGDMMTEIERATQFVEWAKTNFTHLPPWGVATSWQDTVHWVKAFAGEDFSDVNGELAQAMWADYINHAQLRSQNRMVEL